MKNIRYEDFDKGGQIKKISSTILWNLSRLQQHCVYSHYEYLDGSKELIIQGKLVYLLSIFIFCELPAQYRTLEAHWEEMQLPEGEFCLLLKLCLQSMVKALQASVSLYR